MSSEFTNTIHYERDADGVVVLTMDDPNQSANTMNADYLHSMEAAVDRLESESGEITGVVLTSAKKTFFAGGDLGDILSIPSDGADLAVETVERGLDPREVVLDADAERLAQVVGPVGELPPVVLGQAEQLAEDARGIGLGEVADELAPPRRGEAVDQLVGSTPGRTLLVNDETWRLAGNRDTVIWLQHSFKLGRQRGQANIIVVHRLAELGGQADGTTGEIASRLVSDADTHILFRQGDQHDATDTVTRLGVPTAATAILARLPRHRCLIDIRDKTFQLGRQRRRKLD